jgi:ABC-type cobalamin/Fe3+-siderophores transport system ATPase subunit
MATTALHAEGLTFAHARDGQRQVDAVSFTIPAGRTLGILGGNECGKTTLAQLLLGNLQPASGQFLVHGERTRATTPAWLLLVRLCFVLSLSAAVVLRQPAVTLFESAKFQLVVLLLTLFESSNKLGLSKAVGAGGSVSGFASAALRQRGVAYISSEHDAAQQLPPKATIEQAISRHMPLRAAAHEARRREVVAALRAAGFQMYAEGGQPTGSPEQYVVLCYAPLRYAMLYCYAMLCYAVLCYAMLCYATLRYAMLYCAMLCYTVLCYAMLCCAMLCCAMWCAPHERPRARGCA